VEGIEWVVADCCKTEFADGSFDIVSCGFGVRNMEDLPKGLRQMYRVLGQGGRACILEFSLPKTWFTRLIYRIYLGKVLPIVAGLVTGRFEAYRYLARTVASWDEQIDMAEELKAAGFSRVDAKKLSFGIATVYIAYSV
jgi:demethylmenaquinone methyltransferase/2-methoxy-6-polyprenyl-1,4-benzoquinol methylase